MSASRSGSGSPRPPGSGTDAGETEREAVPLQLGANKATFQPGDQKDMFVFAAAAGAAFQMRSRPDGGAIHGMSIVITDEDGVEIARQYAPNSGAAVRLESFQAPRAGKLYATVSGIPTRENVPYSIELTSSGGSAPSATSTGSTASDTATAGTESEERSLLSRIPGGGCTCAALAGLLLLGLISIGAATAR